MKIYFHYVIPKNHTLSSFPILFMNIPIRNHCQENTFEMIFSGVSIQVCWTREKIDKLLYQILFHLFYEDSILRQGWYLLLPIWKYIRFSCKIVYCFPGLEWDWELIRILILHLYIFDCMALHTEQSLTWYRSNFNKTILSSGIKLWYTLSQLCM